MIATAPAPPVAAPRRLYPGKGIERLAANAYNAGDHAGAIPLFLQALRLGMDDAFLHTGLGTCYMYTGQRREAIAEYRLALARGSQDIKLLTGLVFLLDHEPGTTLELALEARRDWWRTCGHPLRATWRRHGNDRDPERPLRIGYVSGDFRQHSAAMVFSPIVLGHSEGYRPVCYMTNPREDTITEIFAEGTEFHRVAALSEDALAARLRADQIDVLVDLAAYSANGRLLTFCRRPAPVQVTGFGYATGTGLPVMDGFFADEVTVPREFAARGYIEPILYLPSIVPFTTVPYSDVVGPLPCLAASVFTFGSLNRWLKMSLIVLETWAEILAATPASRLLLKGGDYERPEVRAQVRAVMARHGIPADRVLFRGASDHPTHLRAYHEIDLALDPFPHTGGVTTLEGLWHGVPPVTLLGERVQERLSASFCSVLNLHTFIASTRDEYIERAILLATRPEFRPKLAQIRATLQHRLAESPLCVGYTARVEQHYRDLWRRWCQRQAA